MKKVLLSCLLLITVLCLVGCGSKKEVAKDNNEEKKTTMAQPVVENEYEVKVKNLRFFIPNTLKVNQYNGYNMTYNYYLDSYNVDDCDLRVVMITKSSYDDSIDKFMKEYVKVQDGNYTSEKINNATWYLGSSSSNITTYTTIEGDYFYNVSFLLNTGGESCGRVNDMI